MSENEEMVRKICRVLCVDVNLSSRLLHCCPFTLCVYIGDFPQIHCGYNKKLFMCPRPHRIFVALICTFSCSPDPSAADFCANNSSVASKLKLGLPTPASGLLVPHDWMFITPVTILLAPPHPANITLQLTNRLKG